MCNSYTFPFFRCSHLIIIPLQNRQLVWFLLNILLKIKQDPENAAQTRMHSSRMRTTHTLTGWRTPWMENPPGWRTPQDGEPPWMENPPDGDPPRMENPSGMENPPGWRTPLDGEPPQMETPPGWRTPPMENHTRPGWRTPPVDRQTPVKT